MSTPDWIMALRLASAERTQKVVAGEIGYSATVVNQVLKGCYPGDHGAVEQAVRGALMDGKVQCPVMGDLRMDTCLHYQRQKFSAINHLQVRLWRACQTCPNNRSRRQS